MDFSEEGREELARLIGHLIIAESQLVADLGMLIRMIEMSLHSEYPILPELQNADSEARIFAMFETLLPAKNDRMAPMYERLKRAIELHPMQGQVIDDFLEDLQVAIASKGGAHKVRNLAAHGIWTQLGPDDVETGQQHGARRNSKEIYYEVCNMQHMLSGAEEQSLGKMRDASVKTDGNMLVKATEEIRALRSKLLQVADIFHAEQRNTELNTSGFER